VDIQAEAHEGLAAVLAGETGPVAVGAIGILHGNPQKRHRESNTMPNDQTFDVCGFPHTLVHDAEFADRTGCVGQVDKLDMKITLSPSGAPAVHVQRAVHEWIHAVAGLKLLPPTMREIDDNEDDIDCLASLITGLVLRNRWLFEPLWRDAPSTPPD